MLEPLGMIMETLRRIVIPSNMKEENLSNKRANVGVCFRLSLHSKPQGRQMGPIFKRWWESGWKHFRETNPSLFYRRFNVWATEDIPNTSLIIIAFIFAKERQRKEPN